MSSFTETFLSQQQQQQQQQNENSEKITITICSACIDLMFQATINSSFCRSSSNNSNKKTYLNAASLVEAINQNESCLIKFEIVNRKVRTSQITVEELQQQKQQQNNQDSSSSSSSSSRCSACRGALENVAESVFTVCQAIFDSPFKDARELGLCTTFPPLLCLYWYCIFAVFVEALAEACDGQVSTAAEKFFVFDKNVNLNSKMNNNNNNSEDASFSSSSSRQRYLWRGLVREDSLSYNGLRGNVVNDLRNMTLEWIHPPNPSYFIDKFNQQQQEPQQNNNNNASNQNQNQQQNDSSSVTSSAASSSSSSAHPLRWTYTGQGAGSGIICDVLFQNDEIVKNLFLSNPNFDPALDRHDPHELTWPRLMQEVCPLVASHFFSTWSSSSNSSSSSSVSCVPTTTTRPKVDIRHEPLFFYGRYRKFSRTMAQSPWFAPGGSRIGDRSLQEEICQEDLLQIFFPGKDLNEINSAASKTDARLALAMKGKMGTTSTAVLNATIGKQEVQELRKRVPQRRKRKRGGKRNKKKKKDNNQEEGGENNNDDEDEDEAEEEEEEEDDDNDNHDNAADQKLEEGEGEVEGQKEEEGEKQKIRGDVKPHMRPVLENVYCFSLYRFHAGGREDVDVRMLGNGRPFVAEIVCPHRQFFSPTELQMLADTICQKSQTVEVDSLVVKPRTIMADLHADAESKRKSYRCVCYSKRPVPTQKQDPAFHAAIQAQLPIHVAQKTPVRVLHRRSSLTRMKKIFEIDIEVLNPHWLIVDLVTQAGTYVKEFCHGDLGRTTPNLATLLQSEFTDIIQLDVKFLISKMDGISAISAASGHKGRVEGEDDDDDDEDED